MNYEAVIGIEIHCELRTKTKMFSGAPLGYGERPNTAINEIDLGYPGTLPQLNGKAVQYGVKLCQALNCEIDSLLRFDRKNYYYSDLPKGYQITQQYHPLGSHGHFDIYVGETKKQIRINRLHLEEDTAKQFHEASRTLIDFNRAGTPLIEIVTEADFRTGEEAAAYVEAIRLLVVYLGVSDGKMAEGSLRCDVNISLRPEGQTKFGTKVEVKNLNSISNVQKAIDFERVRQKELLDKNDAVISETRRFDEKTQSTVSMRQKETAVDYRYFVEPNIAMTRFPKEWLETIDFETPIQRLDRYVADYALSYYDASVIVRNKEVSDYFDYVMKKSQYAKLAVNWLTQDLLAVYDQKGEQTLESWLKPENFVEFLEIVNNKEISSRQAKEVFSGMLEGDSPRSVIKKKGMIQVSDDTTIISWIETVLLENPQVIVDYKNGLDKAQKFVVGQVMKLSKGQANPQLTTKLTQELLDKQ